MCLKLLQLSFCSFQGKSCEIPELSASHVCIIDNTSKCRTGNLAETIVSLPRCFHHYYKTVTILRFPRFIYMTQIIFWNIQLVNTFKIWLINFTFYILIFQRCTNKCFSTTVPPLSIYLECSPTQCIKKNATVKFVISCQQPRYQDLHVNIAHIRSKTFRYVRKYIKFVKVSFQALIK